MMKRAVEILAGAALLGALLLVPAPGLGQTPTPTLTPTVTPTPITVSANAVYTLCSLTSGSSVCGRIRKAATQATTAAYGFQITGGKASYAIWTSCDNASGGTSQKLRGTLTYTTGETLSVPVSEVGPCTIGVTPTWTSGTATLVSWISGDLTMMALPTPSP